MFTQTHAHIYVDMKLQIYRSANSEKTKKSVNVSMFMELVDKKRNGKILIPVMENQRKNSLIDYLLKNAFDI